MGDALKAQEAESNQAAGERCGRLPKVAPQGAPRLPGGSGVNVESRGSRVEQIRNFCAVFYLATWKEL